LHDLFNIVRPSDLFSPDAILDAIRIKTESRVNEINFRGHLGKSMYKVELVQCTVHVVKECKST